ncbi:MAG TPA: T9SS type A sorting domain-containing protein [bacterium]|nr:T9SS type A sorting domain-containing protein [bacterium]
MWLTKLLMLSVIFALFNFFQAENLFAQGSWKIIRQIDTLTIYTDVDFVDKNNGWVVGYVPESLLPPEGVIIHTRDGGESWEYQKSITGRVLYVVDFVDSLNGWALADSVVVFHTNDGGRNWNQEPWRGEFSFIDSQRGWRIGNNGRNIFFTNDGGNTWTILYTQVASLARICFVDSLHGWVMEDARVIFHTRDGGQNWEEQYRCSSCPLLPLGNWEFIDNLRGWMLVKGELSNWAVLRTLNGGQSWYIYCLPNAWYYADIAFVDSLHGWIVGAQAIGVSTPTILYTDDGGETWTPQETGMGEMGALNAVGFMDTCTGWAVGVARGELGLGTVLKYTCGSSNIDNNTLNDGVYPDTFQLLQNYPNPFNLETTIRYYIPHSDRVNVSIYDVHGRLVKNLISNEMLSRGYHEVYWDGRDQQGNVISSGVYLCMLKSEENVKAIKLVTIK